jgi:hypothetical protein
MIRFYSLLYCIAFAVQALAQDIPVDPHTGRPLINIPLAQLNDRNLTHNIGLFYDASGVKIDNVSGLVGTNWQLIAGGSITRELRGLPDDINTTAQKGWLYNNSASTIGNHTFPSAGSGLNCDGESNEYTFINGLSFTTDTEPDIFHFGAGELSGSFVFDNTGNIDNIKLIPYQDVTVKAYLSGGSLSSFEIFTASGIKYTFSLIEVVNQRAERGQATEDPLFFRKEYHQFKNGTLRNNAWKLTSIESPAGEKITITYTSLNPTPYVSGKEVKIALGGSGTSNPPTHECYSIISEEATRHQVATISTPHQYIYFVYEVNEWSSEMALLKSITIKEKALHEEKFVKELIFGYKTLSSSFSHESPSSRIFLREIKVRDNCEVHQPMLFDYYGTGIPFSNSIDLPSPGSNRQNLWGYYVENGAAHKFPTLYVYPSLSGIQRISLFQISGQADEIIIPGSSRIGGGITAGTLSKITYPSGAETSFTYSPHSFFNPITNSSTTGGGLRVTSVRVHDGISTTNDIVRNYEYKKADGTTSGKILSLPTFWQVTNIFRDTNGNITDYAALSSLPLAEQWDKLIIRTEDNLNPDFNALNSVVYERVVEKISTGKGQTVYEYAIPYTYGATPDNEWSPSYLHMGRLKINNVCPPSGLNLPGYYQHPFTNQTPYSFGRGLPIKTSWFAEGETEPLREVINVFDDKSVSPVTVKGLSFEYIPHSATGYYFMYAPYSLAANKEKVLTSTTERIRSRELPYSYLETTTLFTYGTTHSFVTSTATVKSDGSQEVRRFKYANDFGTPQATNQSTALQVRMIDALNTNYQGGTLIEQTLSLTPSGGAEKTYGGTLMLFDDFHPGTPVLIKPKEVLSLVTAGESSFSMSSFNGSGTSRTFEKNNAYVKKSSFAYKTFGDLIKAEDDKRMIQSFHPDSLTGVPIASVVNAEPHEVVFSNFDQHTRYSFNLAPGFTTTDKTAYIGRSSGHGLGGWKSPNNATRYLTKTFTKRPGSKYVFSASYKVPVVNGTHAFNIIIKNTSGTQLLSDTVLYIVHNADTWYYREKVFDLSAIVNSTITVEVLFIGTFDFKVSTATLDDVGFVPQEVHWARNSYNALFRKTSATAPDGLLMENEYDPAGKLKYVRDRHGNILQKTNYTSYRSAAQSSIPISIGTESTIYDGVITYFTASTSCIDISTLQWKVEPTSNPGSGTYANGSAILAHTFTNAGTYVIWLKTSHATYGSYETSTIVNVELRPLTVSICVEQGATTIDLCNWPNSIMETQNCEGGTLTLVPMDYTTFSASVSDSDIGASYSYAWYRRPYSSFNEPWEGIPGATGSTVQVWNLEANGYFIKCVVTSNYNRTGESNTKGVFIYRSNPDCDGPFSN